MTDIALTFAERAILANQFRMLEIFDPTRASDHAQSREIIEAGYQSLYETINPAIRTIGLPTESSREVHEILDMFSSIEYSVGKLGKSAKELSLAFEGFDGNNEDEHYGFAVFMRRKQGKWAELAHYPDNSHSTVLPRYRNMLGRWQSIGRPTDLGEQHLEILANRSTGTGSET